MPFITETKITAIKTYKSAKSYCAIHVNAFRNKINLLKSTDI